MIIVTGANGQLGSQIVEQLLTRIPAAELGVSVRDVEQAAGLSRRGVRVRRGDFTDPASLEHAFEGAEQVLVISAAIRGDGALTANNAAIDAARAAGARRVLYTSHQGASPTALFPPHTVHAATERHLAAAGMPFTALRNGFYANTLGHSIGDALTTGILAAPADGPVSWTAHADLAEAAAIALTREGVLDGVTAPLTAIETFDLEQVARILTNITGRTITRVVVNDEEWKAAAIARGLPPAAADFALGMYMAARAGEYNVTNPTLEQLFGHPTTPAQATLEAIIATRT